MEKTKKTASEPKVQPKTDTSKVYELAVLLLPSLSPADVEKQIASFTNEFTSRGGELISSEAPVMINLAYPMVKVVHTNRQKCQEAYFGWMKFEIETEAINEIKKVLDGSEIMLRYLLVKTVRENTLINGKMNLGREEDKQEKAAVADAAEGVALGTSEAPEGELDKTIEDLVIA